MKPFRPLLLAMLVAMPLQDALAADWQLVLSDRSRRVEIDRASIFSSDRGTKVSWGRVVLGRAEAAASGYATIKALNRYDCQNRTFATVKRVYLDIDDNIVREEPVADAQPLQVTPGSVDERMWREVCGPPSAADIQKVAGEIQKLAGKAVPQAIAVKPAERLQPVEASARPGPIEAGDVSAQPLRATDTQPAPASIVPGLPGVKPARPDAQAMVREAPEAPEAAPQRPAGRPEPVAAVQKPKPSAARKASAGEAARPRATPPARSPGGSGQPQALAAKPVGEAAKADPLEALLQAQRSGPAGPGWSYEGETGPDAWGRLRPDWRTCSEGQRQSPIDLREGLAVDLAPVKFHYHASGFRISDTGNTLQVDVGGGMGMEVRGVRYELERFTLHRPSQERIGGMAYDMAMYLEHRSAGGDIAMLAVQLTVGTEPNALLQTLWNNLPLDRGREYVPDAAIDLATFVPADPAHFLYLGSLPTPPCTEDVVWVVMKTPVEMSADQLALFSRLYARNTRPIQPTNGRLVLESR
ncbi:surface-adhesin E family protein [Thauera sp. SDU_THAU2]|uniref:surface-adhesin E family protein n=1 Tax=Thauera sp. SDU_THAU2 TaxID=3136633 RepID=UPI00311DDE0A